MSENYYHEKYFKYKTKYLELLGGAMTEEKLNQIIVEVFDIYEKVKKDSISMLLKRNLKEKLLIIYNSENKIKSINLDNKVCDSLISIIDKSNVSVSKKKKFKYVLRIFIPSFISPTDDIDPQFDTRLLPKPLQPEKPLEKTLLPEKIQILKKLPPEKLPPEKISPSNKPPIPEKKNITKL